MNKKTFAGFAQEGLDFLQNVKKNNSKAWFEENKDVYQKHLLKPFQSLVTDLVDTMLAIDDNFEIRPSVNKTISRIYRDTRFSKDKSLFKNTMWLTFKRPIKDWKDAPAYFFELSPNSYRYGMGYYSASRNTMDILRKNIDEKPSEFLNVISFYNKQNLFTLEGEKYKKILNDRMPKYIQEWYQRKSFYLVHNSEIDDHLFSPILIDELISGFKMLKPLYRYLWKIYHIQNQA